MIPIDYTTAEICQITQGRIVQLEAEIQLRNLQIDSRKYDFNSHTLFIAIVGEHNNGHEFIPGLYARGVRAFMVSEDVPLSTIPEAAVIRVDDSVLALQALAELQRQSSDARIVAITGSSGKTVFKEWLYQLLYKRLHVLRSPKSYNSQIGVSLSLLLLEKSHDMALIEAGISQPNEMAALEKMIRPEIGIFTNIGPAHRENFASMEAKVAEKLTLFDRAKTLIYCRDHTLIHTGVAERNWVKKPKILTWSLSQKADLQIISQEQIENQTKLKARYHGETKTIDIPFASAASIENCCGLWLLLLFMEIEDSEIAERFAELIPVAMRMEQLEGINDCVLINGGYNSDINALSSALDYLIFQIKNLKYTVIFSDIVQSNIRDEKLYAKMAELLRTRRIDRFIGIGTRLKDHSALFYGLDATFYESTDAFLAAIGRDDFKDENILVQGARSFGFNRIIDFLQKKTHETVLEVDLTKMIENLNVIRSKLNPDTQIMAMIKAFGYGNGSYDIARVLEYNRVDYLAVAYADEGIALREDGIRLPILVMNPEVPSYSAMIQYRLEPQIFSFRTLELFSEALRSSGEVVAYPAHIKINTGMNRLGFDPKEMEQLGAKLSTSRELKIQSVFSHLVGSDEAKFDAFTKEQISIFTQSADVLARAFDYKIMRHILNSGGILRHSDAQMDMVRLGLALYGLTAHTANQAILKPVGSLKTTIVQIREINPGEGVGYSPKSRVKQRTKIGVISVGYADGLPRSLGNGLGHVWVSNRIVPFIGNICMDMAMVDITGVDCAEGDSVEIFGAHLSIYNLAEQLNTIPYEVITTISRRVKRVFVQD